KIARKTVQSGRNKRITAATKLITAFWPVPFHIARGVAKVKTRIANNSKIRLILLVLKTDLARHLENFELKRGISRRHRPVKSVNKRFGFSGSTGELFPITRELSTLDICKGIGPSLILLSVSVRLCRSLLS